MRPFIMIAKSPKVIRVIGSVRRRRRGFINVLITPNTTATTRAVTNDSTETPGRMYAAINTANPLIKSRVTRRISLR